jgi:hypothetical protein
MKQRIFHKLSNYFGGLIIIFLIAACELEVSRKPEPKAPDNTGATETPGEETKDLDDEEKEAATTGPEVILSPLPTPETIPRTAKYILTGLAYSHYQAEISWNRGLTNVSINLNGISVYSQQDIKTTTFNLDLASDTAYSIKVYTVNDDRLSENATREKSLIAAWEIRTPKDLLLTQASLDEFLNKSGEKIIEAHRIFLEKDKEIVSSGSSFTIKADELFTDGSIISTFPVNLKAALDTNGRSGGNIFIISKRAHGRLNINMRGEHGGDGVDGIPHTDRAARGADGKEGYCGWSEGRVPHIICEHQPGPGGAGAPGANGRPGSNGGSGGNTGLFKIQVVDDSPDFLADVKKTEGVAGNPGRASQPQLGGLGGYSGRIDGRCCPSPNPPNYGDGPNGQPGTDGVRQTNGLVEPECISIGAEAGKCF